MKQGFGKTKAGVRPFHTRITEIRCLMCTRELKPEQMEMSRCPTCGSAILIKEVYG